MAAWRRRAGWACAGLLALSTGCSYDANEPGLFPPPETTSVTPVPRARFQPQPTNPKLPVAGERIFVSGYTTLPITFRYAVHAVRRTEGATVLDWSLTPVSAPGYGFGDSLPSVELGLEPDNRKAAGLLVDPVARLAYAPLTSREDRSFNHCLCTPLLRLKQDLRIGETRLLQTAFPALPASVGFIDVDLRTVAPVRHVPVSPVDTAPVAAHPTDLARPAEVVTPGQAKIDFRNPSRSKQFQWIRVARVLVAPDRTTLEWTLTAVTEQTNRVLSYGPPVTADHDVEVVNANPASGPVLRTGSTRLVNLWTKTSVNNRTAYDCLCNGVADWATGLRNAGVTARLVTNFAALPAGTRTVDVDFGSFGIFRGVPVQAYDDAARQVLASEPAQTGTWTFSAENLPYGWPTSEWPTDVPDGKDLGDYNAAVEPLVTLPAGG